MATAFELYRQGKYDEIWQKYCGFVDLDVAQFMHIQRRLLEEQLQLLGRSRLGLAIFGGEVPASIEAFRA